MSTLTTRAATARKETIDRTPGRARKRRIRRRDCGMARKMLRCAMLFGFLVSVFAYIGIYANVTATSYDRSRLTSEYRREKIKNERLKVEMIRLSGPGYAMAAAQAAGMVYAKDYDYLRGPETVARVPDSTRQ